MNNILVLIIALFALSIAIPATQNTVLASDVIHADDEHPCDDEHPENCDDHHDDH